MKKILLVIFISMCWVLNAQHILNGSFENNDVIHFLDSSINANIPPWLTDAEDAHLRCKHGFFEKDYNRIIEHSRIFKPQKSGNLDTVPADASMLQTDCLHQCIWGPEAAEGRWYSSVVTVHYFKISNNDFLNLILEHHHDYLSASSLEFSQALDSTKWYQLTYLYETSQAPPFIMQRWK